MTRWLKAIAALSLVLLIGPALADRDGSGNYSAPNIFTAGSTITAAGHNQNWTDISAEMTNSLPRDGQAGMTGQFTAATGSLAAPSISFTADSNTGFYSLGSGSGFAVVVDGASVGAMTASGFNGSISGVPPPGSIIQYAGTTEPSGYLFCYGQAVSRATYADLFAIVGTTYGVGDGATTFNLPDLRGRVVAGQDDMGGSSANRLTGQTNGVNGDTLAAAGGLETFTLATANLPAHSHDVTGDDNFIEDVDFSTDNVTDNEAAQRVDDIDLDFGDGGELATGNTGSGTAMPHIQPTLILNFIIKI